MRPRANTLGLIIKCGHLLLEELHGIHSKGEGYFYRPIGGTIELGERSDEALKREYQEELGVEIVIERYICCLENIFRIGEQIGHEITQIYFIGFKDGELYNRPIFTVTEGDRITCAKWVHINEILNGSKIVYPNGLSDLLREHL
ncbi:NUDIX hydrolase [Peribacillus sp. SCS-26]|uniref:NUDIX hydrolase n=1 Tax=Paraperibacillus marinus TaxID=3115295 RepID=UPI003905E72B